MTTPNMGYTPETLDAYPFFAIDTGCYSAGGSKDFDLGAYLDYLKSRLPWQSKCLFATAPDVVGDAQATWERSKDVLPLIRAMGYKVALVAQDGIENIAIDWAAFDCLFVGGSTEWKLSSAAYEVAQEAKRQGKWLHMGRVNSRHRLMKCLRDGYDSADGTYLAFGPDVLLPKLRSWVGEVAAQTRF